MENHIDMLIFHTAICAGASQIALMADEKLLSQISHRPVAKRSGMGIKIEKVWEKYYVIFMRVWLILR